MTHSTEKQVTYDAYGRMQYHPDFHPNHGKPWKTTEQKYLIDQLCTGWIGTSEFCVRTNNPYRDGKGLGTTKARTDA